MDEHPNASLSPPPCRPSCGVRLTERMQIITRCSRDAPTSEMPPSLFSFFLIALSLPPPLLPLLRLRRFSGETTTPQTLSTIFKQPVCVCIPLVSLSCLFDCSPVDTYLLAILLFNSIWTHYHPHTLNYPHLCSHTATFQ